MKKFYIILVVISLLSVTGCGYKGDPIYVDEKNEQIKK